MRLLISSAVGGALAMIGIVVNLVLRFSFKVMYTSMNALAIDTAALAMTGAVAAMLMLRMWRYVASENLFHRTLSDEVRQALQIINHTSYLHATKCGCECCGQWYDRVYTASNRIKTSLNEIEPKRMKLLQLYSNQGASRWRENT